MKKKLVAIITVVSLMLTLSACGGKVDKDHCRVAGTMKDAVTGKPVSGMEVSVERETEEGVYEEYVLSDEKEHITAEDNGKYEVVVLPGSYRITVSGGGYDSAVGFYDLEASDDVKQDLEFNVFDLDIVFSRDVPNTVQDTVNMHLVNGNGEILAEEMISDDGFGFRTDDGVVALTIRVFRPEKDLVVVERSCVKDYAGPNDAQFSLTCCVYRLNGTEGFRLVSETYYRGSDKFKKKIMSEEYWVANNKCDLETWQSELDRFGIQLTSRKLSTKQYRTSITLEGPSIDDQATWPGIEVLLDLECGFRDPLPPLREEALAGYHQAD